MRNEKKIRALRNFNEVKKEKRYMEKDKESESERKYIDRERGQIGGQRERQSKKSKIEENLENCQQQSSRRC